MLPFLFIFVNNDRFLLTKNNQNFMDSIMIYLPIIMAVIGLLFMFYKRAWVLKQDAGDGKMKEISDYIYEGALAFLKAEYKLLTFL